MLGFDIHRAGIGHLLWKRRLRSFLDGKDLPDKAESSSHRNCELGVWMYQEGLKKYGGIEELKILEVTHIEYHKIANRIIHLKVSGNTDEAEREYIALDELSKKIIMQLTAVGLLIN